MKTLEEVRGILQRHDLMGYRDGGIYDSPCRRWNPYFHNNMGAKDGDCTREGGYCNSCTSYTIALKNNLIPKNNGLRKLIL